MSLKISIRAAKAIILTLMALGPIILSAQIPTLASNYHNPLNLAQARLSHPDSVKALLVKRGKLRHFPTEVFTYKNLEYLEIRYNRITYIPDSIKLLKNLLELNLSGNPIDSISPSIAFLKKIKFLRLGKTELVVLPPEIGKLTSLEFLDIWGTFITWPPPEIALLSENLKLLDMRVIRMNNGQQERMLDLLPSTKIFFSKPCNCNFL